MKTLDQGAAEVFLALTAGLEGPTVSENSHCKVANSEAFMPVHVEHIGNNEYSIAHYGKQNGDLMRDPEMVFHRNGDRIHPIYFRNDYVGTEEFSARRINGSWEVNDRMQYLHTLFANQWLLTIKDQQGLDQQSRFPNNERRGEIQ